MKSTTSRSRLVTLFDLTHMMSMVDHMAIGIETLWIVSVCSLEKELIELICMNS